MVTNRRSFVFGIGTASSSFAAAGAAAPVTSPSGGASEGQRKTRSIRSCAPGWRCTAARIAAGGTLKSTPATVTGTVGASRRTAAFGQVGHNT